MYFDPQPSSIFSFFYSHLFIANAFTCKSAVGFDLSCLAAALDLKIFLSYSSRKCNLKMFLILSYLAIDMKLWLDVPIKKDAKTEKYTYFKDSFFFYKTQHIRFNRFNLAFLWFTLLRATWSELAVESFFPQLHTGFQTTRYLGTYWFFRHDLGNNKFFILII